MASHRRVLNLAEVRKALGGIGKTGLYRLIEAGEFPAPLPITAQGRAWLEWDVLWYLHGLELGERLKKNQSQLVPPGSNQTHLDETAVESIEKKKSRG